MMDHLHINPKTEGAGQQREQQQQQQQHGRQQQGAEERERHRARSPSPHHLSHSKSSISSVSTCTTTNSPVSGLGTSVTNHTKYSSVFNIAVYLPLLAIKHRSCLRGLRSIQLFTCFLVCLITTRSSCITMTALLQAIKYSSCLISACLLPSRPHNAPRCLSWLLHISCCSCVTSGSHDGSR